MRFRYVLAMTGIMGLLVAGSVRAMAAATGPAPASKPNIIYIILDELGYYEMSHMGHPVMQTPNIDRLATDGMRFTQFLSGSSTCGPTRCALLTGKHMGHATVRTNQGYLPLRAGEETIGSVLKRAGYATGGFGKWGVGGRNTSGVPEKLGFDVFFGYYDQRHAHTYYPRYLIRNSEEVPLPGNTGNPAEGETYAQTVIFHESMNFIRENKDKPFFCYLPWTPPHGHWGFPKDDPAWALFKDRENWPKNAREYAAMVSMVDRQIGEMLALLDELDLADNTLIFFTGDNGGSTYFASPDHPAGFFAPNVDPRTGIRFRGGKRNFYEGGLRVPALAYWPGKIAPGQVSDYLGYFPDLLPTFADLAGAEIPEDIDGISIVPTLLQQGEQSQHRYLYWEDHAWKAVRKNHWKAVSHYKNKEPWALYDLRNDISEEHDLAARFPGVLKELIAYAEDAHTPVVRGDVYDRALTEKDANYFEKPGK